MYLYVEMPRDDIVGGVCFYDIHFLDNAEVGAVDGQGTCEIFIDNHVAAHLPPLVYRSPQVALLILCPGMLG